jgi:ethanolamine utilization protein EutN
MGGRDLFLARVIGPVVCTIKHPAYNGRPLLLVEPIDKNGTSTGDYNLAVDYVGAGRGDLVIAGGPPGSGAAFGLAKSPISTWVMAIVEKVEVQA